MKRFLIIFLLCVGALAAGPSGTYYIDFNAADDTANGTSPVTPWKHCPGMTGFAGSYTHASGDRFIFKGGVTWTSSGRYIQFAAGGAAGNPDYYGVDPSYYTGASWTRPKFDGGGADTIAFWLVGYDNITIDNFEFTNWGQETVINAYQSTGLLIENCYFQSWVKAGFTDDNFFGVQGYSWGTTHGTITNCVFDGSPGGTDSGYAVYHWTGDIRNCVVRNMVNGFVVNSGTISGCTIGPINTSYSGVHPNGIEQTGGGVLYVHDNVLHDVVGCCIIIDNGGGADSYVWNNVIYNVLTSDGAITPYWVDGSFTQYCFNNTISPAPYVPVRTSGLGSGGMVFVNNHVIDGGTNVQLGDLTYLVSNHNLFQTSAEATAAGYTLGNLWRPTLASSPTVDAGTNEAPLFNTDILSVSRPQGAAWDIGAYEFVPAIITTISGRVTFGAGTVIK